MLIEFFFHSLFYLSWSHADIRLNVLSLYIFFRDSKISAAVLYVSSYCDMVQ